VLDPAAGKDSSSRMSVVPPAEFHAMWPLIGEHSTHMMFYVGSMVVHTLLAVRPCRQRGVM